MGEIGTMVSRLQQEGFDLEDMIDAELRAAGFLELCERTTRTLLQRATAIEESHAALRRLLDSIDSQVKDFQRTVKSSSLSDSGSVVSSEPSSTTRDGTERSEHSRHKTVIVIDDDEKEDVDVSDMSHQATIKEIQPEASASSDKTDELLKPESSTQTGQQKTLLAPQQQSTPVGGVQGYNPTRPALERGATSNSGLHFSGLPTMRFSGPPLPVSKPSDTAVSSVSNVTKAPAVIYRTLKSPVVSGAPLLPRRVNLLSSPQELPMPHAVQSLNTSIGSTAAVVPPTKERVTTTAAASSLHPPAKSTASDDCTLGKEKSVDVGPPKFEVGTRVIGQRSDELWYPGVIEKILTDKHNQAKYKVKFDKGTRGLVSSNHIALESNPEPSALNVGSRVVALRPRDTAEENASWRKPSTGIYGKLDVLYAGIVAEKVCGENKNRFLVFFDDGFAQYLPVKKLHHVYHTGKKVWNEVADHSKEFIQEYLEEFPNRPMVKLRVNQWVKTEWRGQWLKAKVMQLDCSLVKMLFQIDNRSEWLYRGSTRLEPLFSALVDGKISTAKKKRSRKLTRGSLLKGTEPYIDYSITKPCFGVSPYSKTDPKGEQQQKLEEKRQQTQLEQLRQQEQHDEMRDKNKQKPAVEESATLATTLAPSAAPSTTTTMTSSSTTAYSTAFMSAPSSSRAENNASETLQPKEQPRGANEGSKEAPSTPLSSGTNTLGNESLRSAFFSVTSTPKQPEPARPDTSVECLSSGHCSGLPGTGQADGGVAKTDCGSRGCCSDSSLSVIQASTARKKTNARLGDNNVLTAQSVTGRPARPQVNAVERAQRPRGIEVIDVDGDSTTAVVPFAVETDEIVNALTSRKNEYLHPNADASILDDIYNAWEAPWLRLNRRDIRSTGLQRAPAFKIPASNQRKQDVASLIQERLLQDDSIKDPVEQACVSQLALPRITGKAVVKGPHKCGPQCISQESIPKEEAVKYNPRTIPLLLKWSREIAQRHPGHRKAVYYRTPCNKRLRSLAEIAYYLTLTGATNVSIDQFTFDPEISCQNTVCKDLEPLIPDISRGADAIQISVVNEVDTCYPPPIDYVARRVLAEGVNMVLDPGFLACCDCTDNCQDKSKCSCAQLTIQATAAVGGKEDKKAGYEFRLLKDCVQTGIYECNQNCACGSQCFNRVVQNGIQLRLQVFKTENRGWGLRALDDIPMGTFVCTYAGQILNEDMANKEGRDFGDEYLAELDHIEVVEKAKEGYESSVSDLEEDDSVIYKTLAGESSSAFSASDDSDASSLSGDESSEADSLFSEGSFSSGRNSRHGDGNQKSLKRRKRKRSSRKSSKSKSGVTREESLMVDRESKAHCLSNLADEKWCYIALKRNHDNQREAAAFLRRVLKGDEVANIRHTAAGNHPESLGTGKEEGDEEERNVQSSDFDFDDVGETFCQDLRAITSQSMMTNNALSEKSSSENKNVDHVQGKDTVKANSVDIIDLTSDNEETPWKQSNRPEEKGESEELVKPDNAGKMDKPVEDGSTDSVPSLLSAEDLSKLAAQNPNLADEPPILTKMNPSRRLSNPLGDTISRLKCRVWTAPPSSDSSNLSTEGGTPVGFEQPSGEKAIAEKSLTGESLPTEPISEPSSPEIENMDSFPPSPSSLRSDVSKPESLDRKSELSTGSSRRSIGGSKPPAKKMKVDKLKIHYSRSHPKPSVSSPFIKASANTPSPSGPSLSRQSSASGKRRGTRQMFGEEHCYVIDAKAYGNCGRYLNHSCSPNLFVQNVFVDTHDLRFPWVAFFTQQNVSAGTELTWDYAYEVGSVKGKVLHCYCGSAECRGRLL